MPPLPKIAGIEKPIFTTEARRHGEKPVRLNRAARHTANRERKEPGKKGKIESLLTSSAHLLQRTFNE
jgi:hypothetical protein